MFIRPPLIASLHRRKIIQAAGAIGTLIVAARTALASEANLELGLLPNLTARVLVEQYEPVQQYLAQSVGSRVVISSASSWTEFYKRAADHQFDVLVAAPHVARLMQLQLGFKPVASLTPNVKATLVCAKYQSSNQLDFIRGKTVVVANPASLVAIEGEAWLAKNGLRAGEDYISYKVKGGDSVGVMVERGEAAAGLMAMGEFKSHALAVKDNLRIVQVFAELPSFVVMVDPKRSGFNALSTANLFRDFSDSVFGKTFEERTGSQIIAKFSEKDALAMDAYMNKTRLLLSI